MKKMNLNQLRKEYLDFFESKDHLRLKSYSLIPNKDKSLLLINAGMAPLKEYFLGSKKMSKNRATSSQRCVRTGDIDNVGKTDRHGTFFEMLGNFSFGAYFKREAIKWAWEFLTEVIEMDKDKLSVSVFLDDDEAYDIWKNEIGLSEDKIKRFGKEDNFWEIEQGPCGPSSEIFYDRGEDYEGDDRFLEIWNLVFTQFNKDANGEYNKLDNPNIDTGMGLERLALVVEDANNIFELDTFSPLKDKIEELSGKKYKASKKVDESIRVIMDHIKAITFLVFDGVVPSNEGRGYVLRRLIRRAYRHGKLLEIEGHFLEILSKIVMDIYSPEYPEVKEDKDRVLKIIRKEEDNFQQTIDQGLDILNSMLNDLETNNQKILKGEDAFKLYDTYGFPLDLTKEIASDKGIEIDDEGFNTSMKEQREKSRANKNFKGGWEDEKIDLDGFESSEFVGYNSLSADSKIIGIIGGDKETISEGDSAVVVLDKTPFYAESGGQIGDTGFIYGDHGKLKVTDTKKTGDEIFYHFVECIEGEISLNDEVVSKVDEKRREAIKKNHSVTHLLNKALKEVLGNHITQAGSYVSDERMRFDFTHFESISKENLAKIEAKVNETIFEGFDVNIFETSLEKSAELGAVGVFEDKYKDVVRVVDMGGYSIELCGGTHVENTSNIMMYKILSETSVASGVRRIEGITGLNVYDYLNGYIDRENKISKLLKVQKDVIEDRINSMIETEKELNSQIESYKKAQESNLLNKLLNNTKDICGVNTLIAKLEGVDMNSLKGIGDKFKSEGKTEGKVLVLASIVDGKIYFVTAVTKDLISKGLKAGDLVRFVAKYTGGNGGGRPDFAQAGGKEIDKVDEALEEVENFIKEKIQ